jgi:hypothetical protein
MTAKTLEEYKNELRDSSRYPYTYACDWLRMKGKAKSRSEAAQLYSDEAEATIYAEQYVAYEASQAMAEDMINEALQAMAEDLLNIAPKLE